MLFHGEGSQRQAADNASVKRKPAPLRGAAAAAAEGLQNRRNTKNPLAQRLGFFVWSLSALGLSRASSPCLQRRRPRPAAEAGRSCWGSGLQDASAVHGTKQTQGAATRRLLRLESRGDLAVLNTQHLLRKPVCTLKAPPGLSCPTGTAVLSGTLLCVQKSTYSVEILFAKGTKLQARENALRRKHFPHTKRPLHPDGAAAFAFAMIKQKTRSQSLLFALILVIFIFVIIIRFRLIEDAAQEDADEVQ